MTARSGPNVAGYIRTVEKILEQQHIQFHISRHLNAQFLA